MRGHHVSLSGCCAPSPLPPLIPITPPARGARPEEKPAKQGLCFRSQWGVPCPTFGGPAPYLNGVFADHAQPPIPMPNLGRACLAGPPVSRYRAWKRWSGQGTSATCGVLGPRLAYNKRVVHVYYMEAAAPHSHKPPATILASFPPK